VKPISRAFRVLAEQFRQGLTPHEVALTLAVGLCLSVPPVIGTTTILCALAAVLLRLNQPLIQAVNFLAYPLQLLLLVPYLRLGEWLFREPPTPLSPSKIAAMARSDLRGTISSLGTVIWHGAVAWALLSVPMGLALYAILKPVLVRMQARLKRENAPGVA
jgi:uncharacterized protein (DUF2062 family)